MTSAQDTPANVCLCVETGPEAGTEHPLRMGEYRVVGRAGISSTATVQVDRIGRRSLGASEMARIEAHMASRTASERSSGPLSVDSYQRGRDILVSDDEVSRAHSMFFVDREGVSVVDLMSTNGTVVNGAVVADAELVDGDIVHLGRCRLVVHVRS